jgi:hypothetical protein
MKMGGKWGRRVDKNVSGWEVTGKVRCYYHHHCCYLYYCYHLDYCCYYQQYY